MATADTTRRQHIHPELGSARNVATTADLQHVRQHACRLVSHFAGQLTGARRSGAGPPAAGGNETGGTTGLPAGERAATENRGGDGTEARVHAR